MSSITTVRLFEKNSKIHIDYRVDGKRHRFSTNRPATKAMMKSFERRMYELAREHHESKLENKSVVLFEDVARTALEEGKENRKSQDTHEDYVRILDEHVLPFFGKMPLSDIKAKDIKSWMTKIANRDISQRRFNKYFFVLKCALDYSYNNEYIDINPVTRVTRNSKLFSRPSSSNERYYSRQEVNTILNDTCSDGTKREKEKFPFIQAFMHVALLTGARSGEIMSLQFSDIDFEKSTITIQRSIRRGVVGSTKTGETRVVFMAERLKEVLLDWQEQRRGERVWVFPNPITQEPYTASRTIVDTHVKPLLKRLKIEYKTLYATRASMASIASENSLPLPLIQQMLGHKDIATTQRYYLKNGLLDAVSSLEYVNQLAG